MVHKIHTTSPNGYGQPVRFYKAVAITFLCLTLGLLAIIVFMSAKRAEITVITRSDSVDVNFPLTLGTGASDAPIKGMASSTVISFEKSFQPAGVKQVTNPTKTGMVTLFNDSATAQPLVATTRLLSPKGILYRLKKGVTVPAKGTILTEVYPDKSDDSSAISEPSSFTIPGLSTSRQKEVYAKSDTPLTGISQVAVISEDDLKRATDVYVEALKDRAKELAMANQSGASKAFGFVAQYTADPDKTIGTQTDSFMIKGKATIVIVSYQPEDLHQYASKMLSQKIIDNNESLQSTNGDPTVSFDSYNQLKNTVTLKVSYTGTVNLDPNSPRLQKSVFFGKSEDEARRYIMSLDHVQSVEMKFKPLWNHTVPQVADHVTVLVKQVE